MESRKDMLGGENRPSFLSLREGKVGAFSTKNGPLNRTP